MKHQSKTKWQKTNNVKNTTHEISDSSSYYPFSTGFAGKQTEQPHKEFLKHCRKEGKGFPVRCNREPFLKALSPKVGFECTRFVNKRPVLLRA